MWKTAVITCAVHIAFANNDIFFLPWITVVLVVSLFLFLFFYYFSERKRSFSFKEVSMLFFSFRWIHMPELKRIYNNNSAVTGTNWTLNKKKKAKIFCFRRSQFHFSLRSLLFFIFILFAFGFSYFFFFIHLYSQWTTWMELMCIYERECNKWFRSLKEIHPEIAWNNFHFNVVYRSGNDCVLSQQQ